MNKWIVYLHIFPNGKKYVGITSRKPYERWHNGEGYKRQYIYRAIKKYKWHNIEHKILYTNLSKKEACNKEIELIAFYDSTNKEKGYNISKGGEGTVGIKPTEESKQKNRIAHLGKKASLETRKKISESNKGKHNIKRTEEQKKKISEATKKAMQNPAVRKRLSETHSGKNHRNYGKHLSEETKEKIRKSNIGKAKGGKKVICIETNKIYESISQASKDTNINNCELYLLIKGQKYNTHAEHYITVKYNGIKKSQQKILQTCCATTLRVLQWT